MYYSKIVRVFDNNNIMSPIMLAGLAGLPGTCVIMWEPSPGQPSYCSKNATGDKSNKVLLEEILHHNSHTTHKAKKSEKLHLEEKCTPPLSASQVLSYSSPSPLNDFFI